MVPTAVQFKRGDRVICKPGLPDYQVGIGTVDTLLFQFVVVEFEDAGVRLYYPHELDAYIAPAERVPLATPVYVACIQVEGVIINHASADSTRYEVAWFDRHFWQVRRKWFSRSQFEVLASKQTAADADTSAEPAPAA